MRTCILGCHDYQSIPKVIENTEKYARITHYDPRCVSSCVAITTAIAL